MLAIAAKTFHRRALCLHCKYLQGVTVIYRESLQYWCCYSEQEIRLKSPALCQSSQKCEPHCKRAQYYTGSLFSVVQLHCRLLYCYFMEKTLYSLQGIRKSQLQLRAIYRIPSDSQAISVIFVAIAFVVYILLLDGIRLS